MAMPVAHAEWTVDMLDALPDDGQRYEIIDGELFVSTQPRLEHQYACNQVTTDLTIWTRAAGAGITRSIGPVKGLPR